MSELNEIGKVYTFNTKAPAILGATIVNAKLTSIIDYETAKAFDNIDLKFRTIYPLLPINTVDDPTLSIYYKFKSESGETIILADHWIDFTTVVIVENISFKITITNASIADITKVRNALNALNIQHYEITQL